MRFLTLTPEQFAEGPAKSGLLTKIECFQIFMNLSLSKIDYAIGTYSIYYNKK